MTRKNLNVKEKMASLDTLSAGIVFGKEDAWDKLQARMDAKPAKSIQLKYWLAAAAMLLLCVTIVTIYNAPEKQVAKNNRDKEIKVKDNNTAAVQTAPKITVQPVVVINKQNVTTATSNKKQTAKPPVVHVQEIRPEINPVQILPAPEVKQVTEELSIAKTPEPSLPVKRQMKVVHVNDQDNEWIQEIPAVAATNIPVPITLKIPVVHLNDINAWQQTVDNYLRHGRDNFAVNIPFLNPSSGYSTPSDNNETHTLHNPLKFKIN